MSSLAGTQALGRGEKSIWCTLLAHAFNRSNIPRLQYTTVKLCFTLTSNCITSSTAVLTTPLVRIDQAAMEHLDQASGLHKANSVQEITIKAIYECKDTFVWQSKGLANLDRSAKPIHLFLMSTGPPRLSHS